jgi:hypothetical protein
LTIAEYIHVYTVLLRCRFYCIFMYGLMQCIVISYVYIHIWYRIFTQLISIIIKYISWVKILYDSVSYVLLNHELINALMPLFILGKSPSHEVTIRCPCTALLRLSWYL